MSKRELAEHIIRRHPEHIWPDTVALLNKWRKDELVRLHDDLHPTTARQAV